MVGAHGGRLVSRVAASEPAGLEEVEVGAGAMGDIENIADGVFSPLEGFLGEADLGAVVRDGRLADGTAWTIPILLDVGEGDAARARDAGEVILREAGGQGAAVMRVDESHAPDRRAIARGVYGTEDAAHPGVAGVMAMKGALLGGRVELVRRPADSALRRRRMTPAQTREAFAAAGWRETVAFQTRNPPHVAHEMLQKAALATRDGVFVNPIVGKKKPGDFADDVIIGAYEAMIRAYYPENRCVLGTLHTEMRYAGPKEAIHHAIMRQNYGCTHIIIGRDHAGVGKYYDPFAAHEIFSSYGDLEIEPVFFPAMFYCGACGAFSTSKGCPHGEADRLGVSGTALREMLQAGEVPDARIMRPEVVRAIQAHASPFVE